MEQIILFDKQLLLEAAMLERNAFLKIGPLNVQRAGYIGIGSNPIERDARIDKSPPDEVWAELHELIGRYNAIDQGYTSRRATSIETHYGNYDHLARFGEWEESDDPIGEDVK
mgnify:CR=1 FL=1